MSNPLPGKGQAYAGRFEDSAGRRLFGEHSYVMQIPADPPAGYEENWIKSAPGRGWFPYFRLWGPTEPWFDLSWDLPRIERVDLADSGR